MAVYIIDEIMGRGKTTAMINHINSSDKSKRFLFITPYLTEVSRILETCHKHNFYEPLQQGGKLNNLKILLKDRKNIVSTHALFSMFDTEVLDLIRSGEYTLIMDEVACVISRFYISDYDSNTILSDYAAIEDSGALVWEESKYDGQFGLYKKLVESGEVFAYNDNIWISLVPTELFTAFGDTYIMTYMFEHQLQRCYFDMHGIEYKYKYVAGHSPDTYRLSDEPVQIAPIRYDKLIHIEQNRKLNQIGDERTALSKSWYVKNFNTAKLKALKNNTYNFFRNYVKTPSSKNLWTTFCKDPRTGLDWKPKLSGKGYAKGFLPCNARGTNLYRDRVAAAYLINRFPDTSVKNFLEKKGIHLDSNYFALSEMLQWVWRTAIRDGKEIYLYIPSKRMRNLLEKWIVDVSKGATNF